MADGFERKRLFPPAPTRPTDAAPSPGAAIEEREDWAERFVSWFLEAAGGDPDIEGVPVGHRWRMEYFDCVRDPRTFEQQADKEIALMGGEETCDGEGNEELPDR